MLLDMPIRFTKDLCTHWTLRPLLPHAISLKLYMCELRRDPEMAVLSEYAAHRLC